MNSGALEEKAVPASYKTPAVLLIYTIKSGKGIGSKTYLTCPIYYMITVCQL